MGAEATVAEAMVGVGVMVAATSEAATSEVAISADTEVARGSLSRTLAFTAIPSTTAA